MRTAHRPHHHHHHPHIPPPPPVGFCSRSPFSARATSCLDTSSWRHGCRLRWDLLRKEEEGATSPLVVATRADDGRDGARRGHSPQLSEGWVARSNARRPTGTDEGELRWKAAGRPGGARAAERGGQGPAAHLGVSAPGLQILDAKADSGPTVVVSHAQDFDASPLPSHGSFRATDGGTVGGSADDHLLFLVAADCGAGRRWWRRWRSLRFTPRTEFNSVQWSRSSFSDCRANR